MRPVSPAHIAIGQLEATTFNGEYLLAAEPDASRPNEGRTLSSPPLILFTLQRSMTCSIQ
jgi:hypothetical protein